MWQESLSTNRGVKPTTCFIRVLAIRYFLATCISLYYVLSLFFYYEPPLSQIALSSAEASFAGYGSSRQTIPWNIPFLVDRVFSSQLQLATSQRLLFFCLIWIHARREFFVPKLQYFLSFKYIEVDIIQKANK